MNPLTDILTQAILRNFEAGYQAGIEAVGGDPSLCDPREVLPLRHKMLSVVPAISAEVEQKFDKQQINQFIELMRVQLASESIRAIGIVMSKHLARATFG